MIEISPQHNEARLLGTLAFLDAGAANATISIYATARPVGGADPLGTPLATLTLSRPCATLIGGVLVLEPIVAPATVTTTGAAVWARWLNGDGVWALDCDVSVEAGVGELRLTQLQLYAGGLVPLSTTLPSTIG